MPQKNQPTSEALESHVLRWGGIIGGIIIVVGVMLILASTQGTDLTSGASAAIPGLLSPETVVINKDNYQQLLQDLRTQAQSNPALEGLVKQAENLPY